MTTQELRKALMSSPKENDAGIRRHIMDDAWVKQRDEAITAGKLPKRGFTISEKKIRSNVNNRLKSGEFETLTARHGTPRASMKFDHPIGVAFVYGKGGKIEQRNTKLLEVVYSKNDGYHFFPVPEEE